MFSVHDYSDVKQVPKFYHNSMECVGIKCINFTSHGRFQIFQWTSGIPIDSDLNVIAQIIPSRTDLGHDYTEAILSRAPWIFLHPMQSHAYKTSFQATWRHQQLYKERAQFYMNQYQSASEPKWWPSNSRYFTPLTILSLNIGPVIRIDDMAHNTVNSCRCSGETTLKWGFFVSQWHQFCLFT